jgi:hypothetical protein
VATNLKGKYAVYFQPGYLPVFCVDNRIYHTCQNLQEALLSGIPDLRKFCYSIPAKAQFRAANHYIGTELSSLVSSVELWVQAALDPGMQSLAKIVPTESLSSVGSSTDPSFSMSLMTFPCDRSSNRLTDAGKMSLKVLLAA